MNLEERNKELRSLFLPGDYNRVMELCPIGSIVKHFSIRRLIITHEEACKIDSFLSSFQKESFLWMMCEGDDPRFAGGNSPRNVTVVELRSPNSTPSRQQQPAIQNNDGRDTCFACGAPTKCVAFNMMVCTKCKI